MGVQEEQAGRLGVLRAAPGNVSFPSGEPSGPPPQGLDGLRSFTLLSSRVTSCGAGPRRGGGNEGRVGRLNKLGVEAGHLQDLPQLLPTLGVRLLASQGPYVGTVMWPQAERSRSLFAEGGKTTRGLLIQPHLSAPGSAAVFALAAWAQMTQGWWAWSHQKGLLQASRPGLGGPVVSQETV